MCNWTAKFSREKLIGPLFRYYRITFLEIVFQAKETGMILQFWDRVFAKTVALTNKQLFWLHCIAEQLKFTQHLTRHTVFTTLRLKLGLRYNYDTILFIAMVSPVDFLDDQRFPNGKWSTSTALKNKTRGLNLPVISIQPSETDSLGSKSSFFSESQFNLRATKRAMLRQTVLTKFTNVLERRPSSPHFKITKIVAHVCFLLNRLPFLLFLIL